MLTMMARVSSTYFLVFLVPLLCGSVAQISWSLNFAVSYQEFLQGFRSQTVARAFQLEDGDDSASQFDSDDLLGLDAKIPGGKFDSEVINQQKNA